ncbi:MAG TPA: glycoside hydrolase family 3 C-terminal domain-containing protein [Pyrinomonadaceae bacterium]|jgi:Beta-glucosidase-related glycosidases|nr:glycoside hydrolase family 3 C-terminal domain-containing protein [Pyrinomonadaceae bacterium]
MPSRAVYPVIAIVLTLLIFGTPAETQQQPPYLNPSLPIDRRVDDLVSRMTLEEKVSQMMNVAPAITRLGIPEYDWWNEALHGVANSGVATVFPQAIGLGATFDTRLMSRVATVISDEARAKYHEAQRLGNHNRFYGLTFWSPNINIFRDPRWGRGQETYGEDPYLTARLGVEFVKGLQGNDPKYLKVVSTPKHYAVHSGPEPERHRFDAAAAERELRETYLPAFRATLTEARAASVMCAYNRTNGEPCCANTHLLNDILRDEWGFKGYVVSDCGAIDDIYQRHHFVKTAEEASALAVKRGTDLECGETYKSLVSAVKQGLISEAEIDRAVKRLFEARFRLGMFDPPEMVPYAKIPFSANDSNEHRQLALEAARESIVLLKNQNNTLPLRKDLKSIAVIGPNADEVPVLLGNYNGQPSRATTALAGIRQHVSASTKVSYTVGATLTEISVVPVPASALRTSGDKPGLDAEYFANKNLEGPPALKRVDESVNFDWGMSNPAPELPADNFSARWTGKVIPTVSGKYRFGAIADDGVRIYLDGKLIAEDWTQHAPTTVTGEVTLEAGKSYEVKMEYYESQIGAVAKLVWQPPVTNAGSPYAEAVKLAKEADAVVLVLGISSQLEGEEMTIREPGFLGGDRTDLKLPARQEALMQAVAATGKPIVVVLMSGSALAVNWADANVSAIVQAWYPGEEGGAAIADVLFGDYNPAGRLPVTFYKSVDQLPPFETYSMDGRTYRFFKGQPLYPFGHGLSYTRFKYSGFAVSSPRLSTSDPVTVSATVENVGGREGDEVVQLYVTDLEASVRVPIRSLAGVERVHLKPGERRVVSFTIDRHQLAVITDDGRTVVEPGEFKVTIGGKQPGFTGTADASTTDFVEGRFTLSGAVTELKR